MDSFFTRLKGKYPVISLPDDGSVPEYMQKEGYPNFDYKINLNFAKGEDNSEYSKLAGFNSKNEFTQKLYESWKQKKQMI